MTAKENNPAPPAPVPTPSRVGIFIDGDNVSSYAAEQILEEASKRGQVICRYVCTTVPQNGHNDNAQSWASARVEKLGFKVYSHKELLAGKNASDIRLTYKAARAMARHNLEVYLLVSSDSDFAVLSEELREDGKKVIGIGRNAAPDYIQIKYDEYLALELVEHSQQLREQRELAPLPPPVRQTILEQLAAHSSLAAPWLSRDRLQELLAAVGIDHQALGYNEFHKMLWATKAISSTSAHGNRNGNNKVWYYALNQHLPREESDWPAPPPPPGREGSASTPAATPARTRISPEQHRLILQCLEEVLTPETPWISNADLGALLNRQHINAKQLGFATLSALLRTLPELHGLALGAQSYTTLQRLAPVADGLTPPEGQVSIKGIVPLPRTPTPAPAPTLTPTLCDQVYQRLAALSPTEGWVSQTILRQQLELDQLDYRALGFSEFHKLLWALPRIVNRQNPDTGIWECRLRPERPETPPGPTLEPAELAERVQALVRQCRRDDGQSLAGQLGLLLKDAGIHFEQYGQRSLGDFLQSIPGLVLSSDRMRVSLAAGAAPTEALPPAEAAPTRKGISGDGSGSARQLITGELKRFVQAAVAAAVPPSTANILDQLRAQRPDFSPEALGYRDGEALLAATGGVEALPNGHWQLKPAGQPSGQKIGLPGHLRRLLEESLRELSPAGGLQTPWVASADLLARLAEKNPDFQPQVYGFADGRELLAALPAVQLEEDGRRLRRVPTEQVLQLLERGIRSVGDEQGWLAIIDAEHFLSTNGFDYSDYGFDSMEDFLPLFKGRLLVHKGRLQCLPAAS